MEDKYVRRRTTLKDPGHPEHDEYRNWLGMEENEFVDPAYFGLKAAADAVRKIK